ncbi:CUB domain-containing protein 1 [Liparis tanakae]|uniref:CUB domain-containing protein 1 n=1 Tax=Liparis tanakae TaxID=230148 RepID=A0A4Z2HAC9_9TELE|nr:CUB domain-containing protein 1 [Liparis tanakae]
MRLCASCALLGLLLLTAFDSSEGRIMVVTVDPSTTLVVSRDPGEPECDVCSAGDCSPTEKTLSGVEKLSLEFGCMKPQDVYSVKREKKIECTQSSCTPAPGEIDPDVFGDFERFLTWDISVPDRTVLTLDFPGGLEEVSEADECPDGPRYSVSTTNREGKIKATSYCKGGAAPRLLGLLGATAVTALCPRGVEVDSFTAKAAPRGEWPCPRGRIMSVLPDPNTVVIIQKVTGEADCSVCINKEPNQKCEPSHLRLEDPSNTTVEFTCPQPQEVFTVEINRDIECKDASCPGNIVQAESSLFPDFNRTFTWDLKVASTRAFQLDFPEPGMRQIPNEDTCPDEHTYSIVAYLRTGPATVCTFCKGGTVTAIAVLYKGRLYLQVPGNRKLEPVDIKLSLPRGASDTHFIAANYPDDFPDANEMQWSFAVPGMHNYTVRFGDRTAPECLRSEVEVEYHREEKKKKVAKLTLEDPQPQHQQGNFNMVLRNCETNRTLQGLTLSYKVSVMRSGHPVLCAVDLAGRQGVSLQVEKVGSDPYCEMSVDSRVGKKLNVAAGGKASLSFLDCPNEDVRLTASKVIECLNVTSCPATQLSVPTLDACLPMPLHSFTWRLQVPRDGTVELLSPTGSLRQSLPGQECDPAVSLHVTDGLPVGDFCKTGMIQKVQLQANVSVTAAARDFSKTKGPFLNVSFSQEISEDIIYHVSPEESSPTRLATPNWPLGMRHSSTVSWIVSVPSQYEAHVHFVNLSQPKCADRHTAIKVMMLGEEEEMFSRREDEEAEDKLMVPRSFYLNMSNCEPEEGHFGAVTNIVLQKKSNLLAILLGLAGVLLLVLTVLGVVCFVTKKRKKDRLAKEASIYIGKGNIFRPSDRHFSKARSENDSHVYDSIDESMMYGHLLGDASYADSMPDHFNGGPVDSYQTFTGPTDSGLPVIKEPDHEPELERFQTFLDPADSFSLARPRTPIDRQDSLGFQDRRMLDNELYTFKSTGDINTIRLSAVDMQPPTISEDSL